MFKVKYVDSIMMLVRLDLNLIVSLFQHKCKVSETVSTTTLLSSDNEWVVCLPFELCLSAVFPPFLTKVEFL